MEKVIFFMVQNIQQGRLNINKLEKDFELLARVKDWMSKENFLVNKILLILWEFFWDLFLEFFSEFFLEFISAFFSEFFLKFFLEFNWESFRIRIFANVGVCGCAGVAW